MNRTLNIALPKGRLGEQVYDLFEKAGYGCPALREPNRRLVFENEEKGVRYFWAKPSDVAIYVERGAADIGVAGKDILLEYRPDVYELLDLGMGRCRMCVAGHEGFRDDLSRTLRVAAKYPNIARRWYAAVCPGMHSPTFSMGVTFDVIVDIVETGKTLRENGLAPLETVVPVSARLIANKARYKFRSGEIRELCARLEGLLKEDEGI